MSTVTIAGRRPRGLGQQVRDWRRDYRLGLMLVLVVMAVVFFVPVLALLALSFQDTSGNVTLKVYQDLFGIESSWIILWNTIRLSIESTLLTLIVAYPLAYFLARFESPLAMMAMIPIVIVPYFTSGLVRTFAWIVLLGRTGLINELLQNLGIIGTPAKLLYSEIGTLIGLLYYFLPLMVLVLYAVMRGLDRSLLKAASVCGAGPFTVFRRVFLPLSMPGVVAAVILTFIDALGSYVTPSLMGGSGQTMWAQTITDELNLYGDWNHAAALGVILVALVVVSFIVADRTTHVMQFFEAQS